MRYRPLIDCTLQSVSFTVEGGQKIGIVGRTASGKSTLLLALLRILNPSDGHIYIDDVDTNKIPLTQLRESITVIPQEPVIFNGSLRFNIDPTNKVSDEKLNKLIEEVGLKEMMEHLKHDDDHDDDYDGDKCGDGLKRQIGNNSGVHLSMGERQMICVVRALICHNKIVVMDEATASVDIRSERLIQEMLKKVFEKSTVLTIAHRINTVLSCHKIMVLEEGEVLEFDDPKTLTEDPYSNFSQIM